MVDDPVTLLLDELLNARDAAVDNETLAIGILADVGDDERASGLNLAHYAALRSIDMRDTQRRLARFGLSSLGRAEAHVLATLDAAISRLAAEVAASTGAVPALPADLGVHGPSVDDSVRLISERIETVFGPRVGDRDTRIMVTMPTEAAHDLDLVRSFVDAGMSVARINAAHDGPDEWHAIAANVRAAAAEAGRRINVAVDLPGPKLRTGALPDGAPVRRARPPRNDYGRITAPVLVRLVAEFRDDDALDPARGEPVTIPVPAALIATARPGDHLRLTDTRGKRRRLDVVSADPGRVNTTVDRTTFFAPGVELELVRGADIVMRSCVGEMSAPPSAIEVRERDRVEVSLGDDIGRGPTFGPAGDIEHHATVYVDVPELFASIAVGDRVLFDDGTITGVAVGISESAFTVEIVRPQQAKLRAGKGINVPDTRLTIPALTGDDLDALREMVDAVDLVSMSYVGTADDLVRLHEELDRLDARVGVILKLENRSAVDSLPLLLTTALHRLPAAVMIARGDLAAEVGFERLAELQEQILWFCAAAHLPVIWATQVLESLAKRGTPSRAEVTDAAWSARADCVMLNKGPYIADSIRFLDDVFARMEEHVERRTPMLRRLSIADGFT